MTTNPWPVPNSEDQRLIDWATVTTNVTGLVLGTAALGVFTGVGYLVIKLPATLDQVIRNQEAMKIETTRTNKRIDNVEHSIRQLSEEFYRHLNK